MSEAGESGYRVAVIALRDDDDVIHTMFSGLSTELQLELTAPFRHLINIIGGKCPHAHS